MLNKHDIVANELPLCYVKNWINCYLAQQLELWLLANTKCHSTWYSSEARVESTLSIVMQMRTLLITTKKIKEATSTHMMKKLLNHPWLHQETNNVVPSSPLYSTHASISHMKQRTINGILWVQSPPPPHNSSSCHCCVARCIMLYWTLF